MTRTRLSLLAGSCVVGILNVAMSYVAMLQIVPVVLGLIIIFIVPGFALICAILPQRLLSRTEELLASVGASVAVSTTAAVALGAAPVGLTRLSFSVVLGIFTLTFSIIAALSGRRVDARRKVVDGPKEVEP